jgi:glycosyltransferase involved in cell wall biosynthesis
MHRMSSDSQPFVTILTPVYNGAAYLADCIDSVLAQDYQNWEYVIVDNCSVDQTRAIADSYSARDPRIRVTTNANFLSLAQNFNHASRMVSPQSRYFKFVCADDWIDPRFLTTMVGFAELHPAVGIVSCHQRRGTQLLWAALPESVSWLSGRDACRKVLFEDAWIFPAPTAALYRADLLKPGAPFFPNDYPHCDLSACFEHLMHADLGVVHEVLAYERVHAEQVSAQIAVYDAGAAAFLDMLLCYGPRYLTPDEFRQRRGDFMEEYYSSLGRGLLRLRGADFWSFHRRRLADLGLQLDRTRVAQGALQVACAELRHPALALRKARRTLLRKALAAVQR